MITLFSVMTDSWGEIAMTIGEVRPGVYIFFVVFVAFFTIGLMNLLTAVFVEALLEQTSELDKREKREQAKERTEMLLAISHAFSEFDINGDGIIDEEEMAGVIYTPKPKPIILTL